MFVRVMLHLLLVPKKITTAYIVATGKIKNIKVQQLLMAEYYYTLFFDLPGDV